MIQHMKMNIGMHANGDYQGGTVYAKIFRVICHVRLGNFKLKRAKV